MHQDNILSSLSPVQKYLKFSAKPELGRFVLDSRPVWLFSSDGRHLVWANTAGLECFLLRNLDQAYGITFDDTTPARRHIAKIAIHATPHSKGRVEILRFLIGSKSQSHACVCRPVQMEGGIFVLAVASDLSQTRSFSERTQALLDIILQTDKKAIGALKDSSGHILAVTQKAPPQGMASLALSALSEAIGQEGQTYVESVFNLNGQTLGLAIEFSFDTRLYQLIILTSLEADQSQDYLNTIGTGETDSALLTSTVAGNERPYGLNQQDTLDSTFYNIPQASQTTYSEHNDRALSPATHAGRTEPISQPRPDERAQPYQSASSPPFAYEEKYDATRQSVATERDSRPSGGYASPGDLSSRMRERFRQSRDKLHFQPQIAKNSATPSPSDIAYDTPYSPQPVAPSSLPPQPPSPRTQAVEPKLPSPAPQAPSAQPARLQSSDWSIQDRRPMQPASVPLPQPPRPSVPAQPVAETVKEEPAIARPQESMRQKLQRKLLQKSSPQPSQNKEDEEAKADPEAQEANPALKQDVQLQNIQPLPEPALSAVSQQAKTAEIPKVPDVPSPPFLKSGKTKPETLDAVKRFSWQTDAEGHIVKFSESFSDYTELDETDWTGRSFSDLAQHTGNTGFEKIDALVRQNKRFSDLRFQFVPKTGAPVMLEFSGIAFGERQDTLSGFRGFGKLTPFSTADTSERAASSQPEKNRQADLDKVMNQSPHQQAMLEDLDILADQSPPSPPAGPVSTPSLSLPSSQPARSVQEALQTPEITDTIDRLQAEAPPASLPEKKTIADSSQEDSPLQSEEPAPSEGSALSGDEARNLQAIADRLNALPKKESSPASKSEETNISEHAAPSDKAHNQISPSETEEEKATAQPHTPHKTPPSFAPSVPEQQKEEQDKSESKAPQAPFEGTQLETHVLDFTPLALLVHEGSQLIYANPMALNLAGVENLKALQDMHGIFGLIQTEPDKPLFATRLVRPDGQTMDVVIRRQNITHKGQTVSLFSIREKDKGSQSPEKPYYQQRYEQALQRLSEVETILDAATDGVLLIDHQGHIATINLAAENLFQIEAEEWIGQELALLFAFDDRERFQDGLKRLQRPDASLSSTPVSFDITGITPDGDTIPLHLACKIVKPEPEARFCVVVRDMRSWKRIEQDLVAAKKHAENANAHKSDFLARVSHEIRTPLNAIIGFSEVMKEERFGPIGSERYRGYLRDIHTSGEHLMSLLNDLLDLSKIEAGKLELDFTSVDMNDVIEQSVTILQDQASRQKIILRTSLDKDLPKVVADTRSMRQIILNLLSNAIKFTKAGGHIIVSSSYEDSGEIVLRVKDTGIGMSERDMQKAMEPFRQIEALPKNDSDTAQGYGTGLGLPLTKALVEANRAEFHLESDKGKGTLIRITFPPQRVLVD
jgi:PAS domain S-box-containing protein